MWISVFHFVVVPTLNRGYIEHACGVATCSTSGSK